MQRPGSLAAHVMPAARKLTRRQACLLLGAVTLPWKEFFAQPAGSAGNAPARREVAPDLGNLDPVMQWIARRASPSLSFLNPEWTSLEAWKAATRPVFRDRLHYQPVPRPLAGEVVRQEERDGLRVDAIEIHATPAYSIPARVLVPTSRRGRLPAVVALHDHGGRFTWAHEKLVSDRADSTALREYRDRLYGGRPWAEALARRGFVVLVSDAFYFGSRRLRVEELELDRVLMPVRAAAAKARTAEAGSAEWIAAINEVCSFYENLTAKTLFAAGATWPGLHVWDDMRTVDYLLTRADVDPGRIGCAGLSLGGIRAAHLIAADSRLKAACVAGWMSDFRQQLRNDLRFHTWMAFIPGLHGALDMADAVALHAPGALLVQQCRRDLLYPPASMEAAVDKLTRLYAKAGRSNRFRGSFHDEPHSFTVPMQDEAFDWLDRWL
jgi:dienelactone hydrolase